MSVTNLKIVFSNDPGIQFFPGQAVKGWIKFLVTGEPLKTKGVSATFNGKAYVYWTETSNDSSSDSNTSTFKNQENYFDYKIYLFGNGCDESFLDPGEHSFPFSYQLPYGIPSSFEGQYGYVRYSIKAEIERAFMEQIFALKLFKADKVVQSLKVLGIVDVNKDQQVGKTAETSKNFCCLWCKHGPLSIKVSIPRSGFVPGDSILVSGEVHNLSKKKISKTRITLIQRVSFIATSKTKTMENIILDYDFPSVLAGESDGIRNFQISVPTLPPSFLPGCAIIGITYEIQYAAIPSGLGRKLIASIPIIIGTIPLRDTITNFARGEFGASQEKNELKNKASVSRLPDWM